MPIPSSREDVIVTEALRRRALAVAERRLAAIIRAARYEELDELIDIFFWFGSPEAMRLEAPEGHFGTPGLNLEEANALVRFRIQRGECYSHFGGAAPPPPSPHDPPSREEVAVTQAFRRRATAIAERCLPTIIREAGYEELEELIAIFQWFGSPEAMRLEAPAGHFGVPGLLLDEAKALVRLRIKRRECYGRFGDAEPESLPAAPAVVEPAGAASPAPAQPLLEPPGAAFSAMAFAPFPAARSAALMEPPGGETPAKPGPSAPQTLYRVFSRGRMWFMDPKTKKIVGEAPP